VHNVDSDSMQVRFVNNDTGMTMIPVTVSLTQSGIVTGSFDLQDYPSGGYNSTVYFCKNDVCTLAPIDSLLSMRFIVRSSYVYGMSPANATSTADVPTFSAISSALGCDNDPSLATEAICKVLVPDDATNGLYANTIARLKQQQPFALGVKVFDEMDKMKDIPPATLPSGTIQFLTLTLTFWNPETFDAFMGNTAMQALRLVTTSFLILTALFYIWSRIQSIFGVHVKRNIAD